MKNTHLKTALVGMMLVIPTILTGCEPKTLVVKNDIQDVEYGKEIPTNPDNYLDLEDKTDEEKMQILADTKVEIANDIEEGGLPIPGQYTVQLTYQEETVDAIIQVADTVKPEFKDFTKEVKTYKDVKPDYVKYYSGKDLSKVTIEVDDSKVDYSKVGTYDITVVAKDSSGNAESKAAKVTIQEPTIKLDRTTANLYVKENLVLKTTINGKDTKAKFTSSNTSVATINADGKITAKKKGTTTLTAEANDVKATCKLTVNAIPKGAKTTTQTVKNPTTGKTETVTVVKPSGSSSSSSASSSAGSSSSSSSSNSSSGSSSSSSGSSSSSNNSGGSTTTTTPKPTPAPATPTIVKSLLTKVNAERAKEGLTPMTWKSSIDDITKTRAKEIVEKFDHERPDGTRVSKTHQLAEIIAAHFRTEDSVIQAWMESSGHRACIMNKNYKYMSGARCGNYWVILFSY